VIYATRGPANVAGARAGRGGAGDPDRRAVAGADLRLECYDTTRQSFGSWLHFARNATADGTEDSDYAGDFRVDMASGTPTPWTGPLGRCGSSSTASSAHLHPHVPPGPMHLVLQIDRIGAVSGIAAVELDWIRHYR
jgi:hypothetical protein